MKIAQSLSGSLFASLLALAIIFTWCLVAFVLDQSVFAVQKSKALMTLGAANGELLSSAEWWRVVTSQFLHVHFLHMLFNVGCIAVIGTFVGRQYGWWKSAVVYFGGGSVGQIASVLSYPELVSSGASQALMALCGASLVVLAERRSRLFVVAIVAIQAALDIYVAQKIKAGHSFGFLAGLLIGFALLYFGGSRSGLPESNKLMSPTSEDARG
jgi:rhomboid protease GluP